MRICALAWGGNGDVLPILALAGGFRAQGHDVVACVPPRHCHYAHERGIETRPIPLSVEDILDSPELQSALAASNSLAAFRLIGEYSDRMARAWIEGCHESAEGSDIILGGFLPGFYIGPSLSEKYGVPFLPCMLLPLTPTRFEPSFALYFTRTLFPFLNRLSHRVFLAAIWLVLHGAVNRQRKRILDLPAAPSGGWFADYCSRDLPVLYGVSPSVYPRPADWPSRHRVVGYWHPYPAQEYKPPAELMTFLEKGPPPVVAGFGSMSDRAGEGTLNLLVQAVRAGGWRAVILTGSTETSHHGQEKDLFFADFIPHSWLLPRAAAAIHHAGAGTIGAVLRAGIPSVAVPHNFDQPFWAYRAHRLGACPAPILRRNLTAPRLASAIHQSLTDNGIRLRAAALGGAIRTECGIRAAVDSLSEFMNCL